MIERKHYPVGEAKTQTFDNKPPLSFGVSRICMFLNIFF